jgi:UDP-N-acetylglucosamine 2-epimerase (non-hydrolysing)
MSRKFEHFKPIKMFLVIGTRPNLMKAAPIVREYQSRSDLFSKFDLQLVHTGQHFDQNMNDNIMRDVQLSAVDHQLGKNSGTHAEQTAAIMTKFESLCAVEKPDWVCVLGDVNSTIACALAAKKLNIKVAHVEAGLRSFNRTMPEEINRLATDAISDLFFATSKDAVSQLGKEGVSASAVHFVGNLMADTLLTTWRRHNLQRTKALAKDCLVTLHRPQNVDSEMQLAIVEKMLYEVGKDFRVIFPCHPRTSAALKTFGIFDRLVRGGIEVRGPASYEEMLRFYSTAAVVLTDSGGVQEETTVLGIPCLTLRDETERPITVEVGTNTIIGLDFEQLRKNIALVKSGRYRTGRPPEFWDGEAAARFWNVFLDVSEVKLMGAA